MASISNPMQYADNESQDFIYAHTALITSLQADITNGVKQNLGTLHHWHHSDADVSVAIPVKISEAPYNDSDKSGPLKYIAGFQNHGTIFISEKHSSRQQLHTMLCEHLKDMKALGTIHNGTATDESIVTKLLEHLKTSQTASPGPRIPVRLYSISVSSSTEDARFIGEKSIWKWMKLSSLYRKHGKWAETFDEAITDGEWKAGMGFSLMIAGLSEEQKDVMFEDGTRSHGIPKGFRNVNNVGRFGNS